VDLVSVAHKMRAMKKIEDIGGDSYLVELSQVVGNTANIDHHCKILLQMWIKRQIIRTGNKLITQANDDSIDVFDILENSGKSLDSINEAIISGNKNISFGDSLMDVAKQMEGLNQDESTLSGVTTGYKTIDRFNGGWQKEDLIIVAARPGMGKTSFILKNILEIALLGDSVGIFSLEMSMNQLTSRILAINSNFKLKEITRTGFKNDDQVIELLDVVDKMKNLNIYVDDSACITPQQVLIKARHWKRKFDIKALFIDYIQLMNSDSKHGNREREIADTSRKFKQLAKELKIPVIALSQLSRAVESRGGDKRPKLSDLRESGAIEQDADSVIFIYRPDYYDLKPDQEVESSGANTEISFAKNRSGAVATRGIWWQGDKTRFSDVNDKRK